jgi:two-component system, chemotaxis family, protein-glutamate methylesterase/glutaminase
MAASAGGLAALTHVLSALPRDLAAPIVVVQHLDPHHRSWMVEILQRKIRLAVKQARAGEEVRAGTVFVAPPDRHLLVEDGGVIALSGAAQVRHVRPSANLLFQSLAESFGAGAIAVVLSGTGEDGADGVRSVKSRGGTVIAQDEASSQFFGMPSAAIRTGVVDRVLPLDDIADAVLDLVGRTGQATAGRSR